MKAKIAIAAFFLNLVYSELFAQIPLVYSVENTGSSCALPPLNTIDKLTPKEWFPDPFARADGSGRSTNFSDWECMRNETKRQIENYEIGIKPPRPDSITAVYTPEINGGRLNVVITRNGVSMTLSSHVNLPTTGTGPFPAVIGIALAPGTGPSSGSIPADIFTSRNIATIEYVHNQVTTYAAGQDAPKANDPFYLLYPELINNGQYSAWIWGVSRLIDGLEIAMQSSPVTPPIDLKHLAITGCSYAGKMALFSGAFDERIALTIAQESGGGGAPAWRASHKMEPNGTVEKIDNTDDSWFMKSIRQFSGDNVYKLPHDHHELMAMVAPRALLVTGNTDFTWLSNRANYVTSMATKEIYRTLGIGDRFGFYIDGAHGHCALPNSQRPGVSAFVDKFLLGQTNVNTDTVMIKPNTPAFDTVNYQRWYSEWGTAVTLPIQLNTFSGERKGVEAVLRWTTSSEQNNRGFEVQSSTDGTTWKTVAFVPTKAHGGNSSTEINYQFSEANNEKAATYYRIIQVDIDNERKFSDLRLIKGFTSISKVMIYPNPSFTGQVKVIFADAGMKEIIVFDVAGRVVQQFKKIQNSIAITNLKTGSYIIQVGNQNDGTKTTHKIVVN